MMAGHEWPEAHRKRLREDDYADISTGGTLGFTEHRSKRLQALPLRTSPSSKRWAETLTFPPPIPSFAVHAAPRTITPRDSPLEEQIAMQQHTWADEPELGTHQQSPTGMTESVDMDMMDTYESIPQDGQQHLEPGQFQPDQTVASIAGRMPTPIHCSFAAQVRGNNWGSGVGNALNGGPLGSTPEDLSALAFGSNSMIDTCQGVSGIMGHDSVPRSLDGPAAAAAVMADWNMVQNRRLPSPISESGGEDSSLESPRMVLDSSSHLQMGHLDHLTHQHPLLSTLPTRSSSVGDLGQQYASNLNSSPSPQREGTPGGDSQNGSAMDVEAQSPEGATSSPRKGHTRSRHTLNSWTALQPGMKRSFSIGYRADCEKCRMKVPGHFNHIIVS
ncbi:hypothetical protein B0T25DRAFT_246268 [Lasiosphaeria hispida]|uniref:Uncharacterized protein n=1 Tax=Lasiosphaeria hispida TaxID=260671 RepID=A0AAJ0MCU7_9PEZI|nr:hypothetical protein B0T25DRAFT_246268 [Lasiosphaeria hispida]